MRINISSNFLVASLSSLLWRHNGGDGVSNHKPHDLLNHSFRRRSNKSSKLRVTGLCAGNSPVAGEFPAQMASNAENVSIWWHHRVIFCHLKWRQSRNQGICNFYPQSSKSVICIHWSICFSDTCTFFFLMRKWTFFVWALGHNGLSTKSLPVSMLPCCQLAIYEQYSVNSCGAHPPLMSSICATYKTNQLNRHGATERTWHKLRMTVWPWSLTFWPANIARHLVPRVLYLCRIWSESVK